MLLTVVFGLSTQLAWASSDNSCEPNWSLSQRGYDRCSSLPILSPGNDTRVNLKLLLVDRNLAGLQANPVSKEDMEFGYGKVPFTLETFENRFFRSKIRGEDTSAETARHYGSATRCISNESGKADFAEAVEKSRDLSAAEKKVLTETRLKLTPACMDDATPKAPGKGGAVNKDIKNTESPVFREFMQYIDAATAFYDGRYDDADAGFESLADSEQPWLKESASYMLGRTEINISQQNAFDSYGFSDLAKVDQEVLQKAEEKLRNHLTEYPDGRYSASARGLLRRVYWLSNQPKKLADEYAWLLSNPESRQNNLTLNELVLEADSKLLASADPKQINNPILLATLDLALMRQSDPSDKKQISFVDLQKQQPLFADHKALFEYLLAAHRFYVQKNPAAALKNMSDEIPQKMTYLDLSRLALRGLALEATKDHTGARKLWLAMLSASREPLQSETLQLALAINYEQTNRVEAVFEPGSPVTEPSIRNILIRNDASAPLLRRIIKSKNSSDQERHIAIYTLLYKDLLQGHYQDYIKDYQFLPKDAAKLKPSPGNIRDERSKLALFTWSGKKTDDSYSCPSTLEIAKKLAKNPLDPLGLVCLGDFAHDNSLEPGHSISRPSGVYSASLGSAPSQFPGKVFSRGEAYKTIIANPDAATDLKAYALFRSIKCYATSGYNHCGGESVEKTVRKSWFQSLKTRYANTDWAKSLKYYW